MTTRFGALLLLVLLAAALPGAARPAAAVDVPPSVEGPLRIEGGPGIVLTLDGEQRYLDTIELQADGTVVNDLSLEAYVAGVAEMPPRWPSAALEAQAIAARTYAWWAIERGAHDGYDICASTACQRFAGAEHVLDGGERWQEAVDATRGQVLREDDGTPALTRYFSTSGGRTYANEEVFPATGARDYLVGIEDPYDEVSPYHRWEARFSRDDFDAIIARGDTLGAVGPVAAVARIGDVDDQRARIAVTGTNGMTVEVGAVAFREFVSRVAPQLFPERFPGTRADGLLALPTTVPSSRFTVEVGADEVVISGRGWGHGVGMGQYGARGRAAEGHDVEDILGAYYGGLAPVVDAELPERIRVGLRDGADAITVRGGAPMDIVASEGPVVPGAIGTWRFERDDAAWRITAPEGTQRPLEVSPTREAGRSFGGEGIALEAEVNKPAAFRLEVRDAAGSTVVEREVGVADPGIHRAIWDEHDAAGQPVEAGTYEAVLRARDTAGVEAGRPARIVISADEAAGIGQGSVGGLRSWLGRALALAVAVPLVLLLVAIGLRKVAT